ncbi:hypothetical protein PRVXT_000641 [Proteinivorax tanatarense]|uniref:Uncharacterized protein n=1 Tax=Proteinivorax tanatarense TaxID=1260629 RepID=A0AAU7VN62_9FIRM
MLEGVFMEAIDNMEPKIKKSLNNTTHQERQDLEQEIKLKAVEAVKTGKIKPIGFWEFKEKFDSNKNKYEIGVKISPISYIFKRI